MSDDGRCVEAASLGESKPITARTNTFHHKGLIAEASIVNAYQTHAPLYLKANYLKVLQMLQL